MLILPLFFFFFLIRLPPQPLPKMPRVRDMSRLPAPAFPEETVTLPEPLLTQKSPPFAKKTFVKKPSPLPPTKEFFTRKFQEENFNPPNSRFYATAQPTPIPLKKKSRCEIASTSSITQKIFLSTISKHNSCQTNVAPPIVTTHQYTNPPYNPPNQIFMTAQPTYFQPIRPPLRGVLGNFTLEPSTNNNFYNMTANLSAVM